MNMKLKKLLNDIQKTEDKIAELQEHLKRQNTLKQQMEDMEIIKSFRSMNFEDLDGPCSRCPHEWCGGGCRSAAMNLTGSLTGSDISCFYAETMESESR